MCPCTTLSIHTNQPAWKAICPLGVPAFLPPRCKPMPLPCPLPCATCPTSPPTHPPPPTSSASAASAHPPGRRSPAIPTPTIVCRATFRSCGLAAAIHAYHLISLRYRISFSLWHVPGHTTARRSVGVFLAAIPTGCPVPLLCSAHRLCPCLPQPVPRTTPVIRSL